MLRMHGGQVSQAVGEFVLCDASVRRNLHKPDAAPAQQAVQPLPGVVVSQQA